MPQTVILEKLKCLILAKIGVKTISPSDCKSISFSIQKEIQKTISETTLKRLFGFAEIKNEFSKYTINTLFEYVEKVEDDVLEDELLVTIQPQGELLQVRSNAFETTLNTLKYIRNRSSVPYELTTERKFARFDFEYFYANKCSFTSFISQAGYGKSILLSHLVEALFLNEGAKYKNDIILLLNATDVFGEQYHLFSIEDRIKAKLGLSTKTDLITYFKEKHEKFNIKLIVIIDGFQELVTDKVTKPIIFDKLINLISNIEDNESIKIICSMRSTMWSRFYERIKTIPYIRNKWCSGSYFNIKDHSNIPPLTADEVDDIFRKMYPFDHQQINPRLKSQLKFPFHIQWYYQLKEEFPAFNSFTNIIFFEIIDRFIQEKIYRANYATEKILYCKKIVQLTSFGKGNAFVLKSDLIKELAVFKNAYMELLAEGILMEEKQYQDGFILDCVRFIQPHVFEYFLFIELLDHFQNDMNEDFFNEINKAYYGNQMRFQLFQWSVRLIIRRDKLHQLSYLLKLNLNNYERNYLIYFIAENLNYQLKDNPSLIEKIKQHNLHEMIMNHLIHFDFIDSFYKDALSSLILVADTNKNALIYHVILSIFDCLSLEQDRIKNRLKQMESLQDEAKKWEINPYQIIYLIYLKISGKANTENDILLKIDYFKSGEYLFGKNEDLLPNNKEMLIFILMMTTNVFYGNQKEAVRIIYAMITHYPKILSSEQPFSTYLFSILAHTKSKNLLDTKTSLIDKIHAKLNHHQSIGNSTPYIQSIYLSSKAYQSKNQRDYATALIYAEKCVEIYKRNNLTTDEISMYNLMINIYHILDNEEKKNEYMHKKLTVLDQKKVSPALFNTMVD
jgi:hypothetical protein